MIILLKLKIQGGDRRCILIQNCHFRDGVIIIMP